MATDDSYQQFDTGRVVSRTFAVIRRNGGLFTILSTLATAPTSFASWLISKTVYAGQSPSTFAMYSLHNLPFTLGNSLLLVMLNSLLGAAIAQGTIVELGGGHASLADCTTAALSRVVPLIGVGILSTVGVSIGTVLLVLPGLFLAAMWSIAIPICVLEREGAIGSLTRSAQTSRGPRWRIVGLIVALYVAAAAFNFAIRPLTGVALIAAIQSGSPLFFAATGIIRMLTAMISATGAASIYYELRMVRDGVGPEKLASVFA